MTEAVKLQYSLCSDNKMVQLPVEPQHSNDSLILVVFSESLLRIKNIPNTYQPENGTDPWHSIRMSIISVPVLICVVQVCVIKEKSGPRWQSGNTLVSHLCGWGSVPGPTSSGKAGSCLPLVGSLQHRALTDCMYWFPLPFQLPVVI